MGNLNNLASGKQKRTKRVKKDFLLYETLLKKNLNNYSSRKRREGEGKRKIIRRNNIWELPILGEEIWTSKFMKLIDNPIMWIENDLLQDIL